VTVSLELADVLERRARRDDFTLTVLYDEGCPLCRRLRDWLSRQPTLEQIEFLPANSSEAWVRYPDLDHLHTTRILTVVSSDGRVYEAERAWLVCAWALPAYRQAAEHLSSPLRRRCVRLGGKLVDAYRHRSMDEDCDTCSVL